ncbi:MAG: helix-turn-helix domain-containing protein [Acidobacteria bacterium]|nr:helix-turn-helix domain-containing protein [Acidobacteriota bacterium]
MRSIIRVEHDKDRPFLTVAKETVRDQAVSFEARGFLMFLLAKPDDWQIRPEKLAEDCGLHRATVYRILRQLIDAGYVRRNDIKRRKVDGTFESAALYTVFEDKKAAALYDEKIPF